MAARTLIVTRDLTGWYARLDDTDAAIMGARWVPLPFTKTATRGDLELFYASRGDSIKVVDAVIPL